jgi:putative CocE/NonD family hydrolase
MQWGVKITMRDGTRLNATLYLPKNHTASSPSIFTLTPYIGQTYHDCGVYFARNGFPFLTVDVRGRGNSEGHFRPLIQEAEDGYDVVEWLAQQPYCNGQVAMWGGSYAGYDQWATAKEHPPHLTTIVPVASPYLGVDFPIRNNVSCTYLMQWVTLVSGRTSQDRIFSNNERFWRVRYRQWLESGMPFKALDALLGNPSEIFQEWIAHPQQDTYWDGYNPTADDYSSISLCILTITGIYDSDQPGALRHYREHLSHISAEVRARHYLVIGPWDHAGTRVPQADVGGVNVGPASLVDLGKLHLEWYAWTMQSGAKPEFLHKNVAYYVMGAEKWRYADTLETITAEHRIFYLNSNGSASRIFASGVLQSEPGTGKEDRYVYDPRDTNIAALEAESTDSLSLRPTFPIDNVRDQILVFANEGKQLIYHSAPFECDAEISGFFKLTTWLAIDQPDTDFRAIVYEISLNGGSILLSTDCIRARYREGLRESKLICSTQPLRYDFESFTFVSRKLKRGSRLRLTIGPINSIYFEKNYNSGGIVAEETMSDARPVTVRLFHDESHPSALYVPLGQPETRGQLPSQLGEQTWTSERLAM